MTKTLDCLNGIDPKIMLCIMFGIMDVDGESDFGKVKDFHNAFYELQDFIGNRVNDISDKSKKIINEIYSDSPNYHIEYEKEIKEEMDNIIGDFELNDCKIPCRNYPLVGGSWVFDNGYKSPEER